MFPMILSACRRLAGTLSAPVAALFLVLPGGAQALELPDLIERVKPSVVVVGTYQRTRSPAFAMRGSGFVVGDGTLVATNAHVVPEVLDPSGGEALVIQVLAGREGGQQRAARMVALDRPHDLALLRIDGAALPPLALASGTTVREGEAVAFTGFPIGGILGLSPVTHRGIVSAVTPIALPGANAQQINEKVIRRLKSGTFDVYQLDATAYPGNSGGPLFEMRNGEVIGIINMVFVKGTKEAALSQPSGISFAIPVHFLREMLGNLK